MKNKTKIRISLSLVAVFFLVLVVGRLTGDPDVDVFYVERTLVSEACGAVGTYTDYNGELLSHNGNYYICYTTDKRNCLPDEAVDEALEDMLGEWIGYVYGNSEIFWATFSDELDEVTNIGLIYQVKGYDESEAVAILYTNYISGTDPSLETTTFMMNETGPAETRGTNLHIFMRYDADEGEI